MSALNQSLTCEQFGGSPNEGCELGELEFPMLLVDPVDTLPEVLLASPLEFPHGLPSLTKTGTATRLGELCIEPGIRL